MKSIFATFGFCVAAVTLGFYATPPHVRHPIPRFIAHACDGAGGDLWAVDKSDFPTNCQMIEEY